MHRRTRRARLEPLEARELLSAVPPSVHLDPTYDTGRSSTDNVVQSLDDSGLIVNGGMMGMFAMNFMVIEGPTLMEDGMPFAMYQDGRHAYTAPMVVQYQQQVAGSGGGMDPNQPVFLQYIIPSNVLIVTIDSEVPDAPDAPDLLASSDSGLHDDDNVTNVDRPAFTGVAECEAIVRVYANDELVGEALVGSDESDGEADDDMGAWEITVEPLDDGVYDITVTQEDLAGNISEASEKLEIEIDTIAPNTPFLDLVETSDTGRHNDDNVTLDNTPTLSMTTTDPNESDHIEEDNYIYRIFDRLENTEEKSLFDSEDILNDLIKSKHVLFTSNTLADGIHDLKLEVEDRAGNISEDFLLDVLVDTVAPPVSFIGIEPAEIDTGVTGYPDTINDRVTSYTAPRFVGRAEADAIVRLYVDANANDGLDTPGHYSLTVALPYDGDDAFPNGQWEATYIYDLNDPDFFPRDGAREILVTAEDLAGNVNQVDDQDADAGQVIDVFIDTMGPRITDVEINQRYDPYDLFDPKPSTDGPTPLVDRLVISVEDLPARRDVDPNFLYDALFEAVAEQPGHYRVVGDANGVIPIKSVEFISDPRQDGVTATGIIVLEFYEPLPDDRFTLTVSDALVDPVGNALDGETNTIEPHEIPIFPSGDGQPGGTFLARFTVDSRPEIGTWAAGTVYVDTNGNFLFDPQNLDYTNRDIVYTLAYTSDDVFVGNFALQPNDTADGFDKLAAYGLVGDSYRWMIDTDNDGVPNVIVEDPKNINGLPVAGNFDGNAANGDEVGLFTGEVWWLDTDHDFQVDRGIPGLAWPGVPVQDGLTGYPIVGDFDGDGSDDLGTWTDDVFRFDFAHNGFGLEDTRFNFGMIGVRERPVAADMDGDGIDDLGLWIPDRAGVTPEEKSEWYFLISEGRSITERIVPVDPADPDGEQTVHFTPIPFGEDLYAQFGDEFAIPLVGNFDPPVSGESDPPGPALVSLEGTPGDDTFEFAPGAAPATWIVTLNGASQTIAAAEITVNFEGQGGHDVVTMAGSGAEEVAKLWPDHGTLSSDAHSVTVGGVESITVISNGGNDVAYLYGAPGGQDTFKAWPDRAMIFGEGYKNLAESFRYVHGYGSPGTGDTAFLFDNPSATDTFQAWPTMARLYGEGYYNRAKSFDYVHAYATPGCDDVAYLYDSPDTPDRFEAYPTMARLFGPGFYNRAKSFRWVHGYATPGGIDAAYLYDSGADDVFEAYPTMARLYGTEFYNRAMSFPRVTAHASSGGYDRARLHDSALEESPDELKAEDDWAGLSNDLVGYSYLAMEFEQVDVDSSNSSDQLSIDPAGVDFLLLINGEEW